MPKTRELSQVERGQIVVLRDQGISISKIARDLQCARSTVRHTIKLYNETRSYKNRPKTGRKRKTTARDERILQRMSLRNRTRASQELAGEMFDLHNVDISAPTVRRRLKECGLGGFRARRKPRLTPVQKEKRLLWARNHQHWDADDWAKVMWSDESNIELCGNSGVQYVRRRQGEAFHPDCIIPTVKFGGGSVMVWGSMSASGVGELFLCEGRMNSLRYIEMLEEVLEPAALKLFDDNEPEFIFQQDNAPCHKSRAVLQWFAENNVQVLEWPAQSPDLSPIEHLWQILKQKVAKHVHKSKEDLKNKINLEWKKITAEECRNLVNSMPRRVRAVIKAKGGSTKY